MKLLKNPLFCFLLISIIAFLWRFLLIPWDFGGTFFQFWITVAGTMFFAVLYPRLDLICQKLSRFVVIPIGGLFLIGTIYLAPQSLIPYMLLAFVSVGAMYLWSNTKKVFAIFLSLLFIPVAFYINYGLSNIVSLIQIRTIHPHDIAEFRFKSETSEVNERVITKLSTIASLANSLKKTYPYSPNHEGIVRPWNAKIILKNGNSLLFRVGDGNRAHRSSVWIEFGVEVYQNQNLRTVLNAENINLW